MTRIQVIVYGLVLLYIKLLYIPRRRINFNDGLTKDRVAKPYCSPSPSDILHTIPDILDAADKETIRVHLVIALETNIHVGRIERSKPVTAHKNCPTFKAALLLTLASTVNCET
jgi:hypothetical protein